LIGINHETVFRSKIKPANATRISYCSYNPDAETLDRLDILEGEGSLYLRKKVDVSIDNKTVEAWTYVWNGETGGTGKISYADQPWKE